MATDPISGVSNSVTAAINTSSTSPVAVDKETLASNFTSFLQLLTTQLKNQNPMDPLDTNQFTQQLVQFSQVEQQLKSNDQLATLIELQKSAQSSAALAYVGQTVAVKGETAKLANGAAKWSFDIAKPAAATVTIKNATGQEVYTGTFTMNAGPQQFVWDGKGVNGTQWPDGNYTISLTAKDASGNTTAIPPEVLGVVDSVDLTQSPPVLAIGDQKFSIDQIKRIVRAN